ncbi:MAG: thiaminase II [candidate division NC10 bacterium]|nr:thiaminase II [candidate division NC10 bacterium]
MEFSNVLRRKAAPIWKRIFTHPFVKGIGDGSLSVKKFRFYMGQDYAFLIEYCRVLAFASAKISDLDTMGRFAELLHATLHTEMALHRNYAKKFGISAQELARTRPAPTTYAYTRHLLQVATSGTMAELAASLLPCQWGYCEIGQRLAKKGAPKRQPLYGEWIRTYASPEFAALAAWVRGLTDHLAHGAGKEERRRMEELYLASCRYEYLFWEMCSQEEAWPL